MWSSNYANYTRVLIAAAAAIASVATAFAVEDLAALRVEPQRGQSADQLRRDRYECHNWAVEQTGQTPIAPSEDRDEPSDSKRSKRAERVDRAIIGAAIGGMIGGITQTGRRHHRDSGDAVLAGAAVGAGVGAATAGKSRDRDKAEAAPQPSEYLRALSACLEGRGYTVTMPSPASASTRR